MAKSSAESKSTTSNTSKDQKQTAGNYAVQIAESGKVADTVTLEGFSDHELDAFKVVGELARQAFTGSQDAFNQSLDQVVKRYENQESDIAKIMPIVYVIGGVASFYFLTKSKLRLFK